MEQHQRIYYLNKIEFKYMNERKIILLTFYKRKENISNKKRDKHEGVIYIWKM